jgi:hypothetical protein
VSVIVHLRLSTMLFLCIDVWDVHAFHRRTVRLAKAVSD